MSVARVRHTDIELGKPLQWDVFDEKGTLLLRRGYVISTEKQIDRLIAVGVFASAADLRKSRLEQIGEFSKAEEEEAAPVEAEDLAWFDVRKKMEALYESLETTIRNKRFESTITELVTTIQTLCALRPELALAVISLRQGGRYSCRHMLDAAIVTHLVARALALPPAREVSAIAAALTMNLTSTQFQDYIKTQSAPLTVEQREKLHQHPLQSADRLKAASIKDPIWLRAVAEHHERIDGSGYPLGLAGHAISLEGQLVGLADVFCARISFKEYRSAVPATVALRGILQERSKSFDPNLTSAFIKAVGIFPPGLLVRLANGDQAVVIRAGQAANFPLVASLLNADGQLYSPAVLRDTAVAEWNVKETVDPTTFNAYVDLAAIWGDGTPSA